MQSSEDLELYLDGINLTSEEINFDEIDDDLASFQQDEMVQQALQRGVDLKKYGRELEEELKIAELNLVTEYVNHRDSVSTLHQEMKDCDEVLSRMQNTLQGFQGDLGAISEDIRHLQDQSLSMNIQLNNRRTTELKLHSFLQNSILTPEVMTHIESGIVNEVFLDAVINLSEKLKYLQQTVPAKDGSSLDIPPCETFIGRTLLPDLERLKTKAIERINLYFLEQIRALKKPKTNVHMLQQSALVKFSPLWNFVEFEMPQVADGLRNSYVENMAHTLQNLFRTYYTQLSKLEIVMATRGDVIVIEDAMKSMFSQRVTVSKKSDPFSLGERDKILEQIESEPILLHLAIAEKQQFPYEVLLRSVIKHLIDAATNEFLFIIDFFKTRPKDTFNRIFAKTLSSILEIFENYIMKCEDSVGILLMIKITYHQRMVMQRRRIPTLDSFFDRITLLLWPRFKVIFDNNLNSVKHANHRKLGPLDLSPHYISKRYAEFVSSVLVLQTPTGGEGMLLGSLSHLRQEMIGLLERLSQLLPSPKDKIVFLINNYDQVVGVLQDRRIESEELNQLSDILMHQREMFAEEAIRGSFNYLMTFVINTEAQLSSGSNSGSGSGSLDEAAVEAVVREFSTHWKTGIQQINEDVMTYFANFRNGMEILKQVLAQLLMYYARFTDIIRNCWPRPPAFCRDIVSNATIMLEIKKYSRSF